MRKYPGQKVSLHYQKKYSFVKKKLTFEQLKLKCIDTGKFIKPIYQGALEESRVKGMITRYLAQPTFWQFKNVIVIGDVNNSFYQIDGQHRIQMACELYTDHRVNDEIIVVYYELKSNKEALELFNEINIDSHKNQSYIRLEIYAQILINDFRTLLKEHYGEFFSPKKNTGPKKCIEEFVDELLEKKFFVDRTALEAFDLLVKLNQQFYETYYLPYKHNYSDRDFKKLFHHYEFKSIINKVIFSTKRNKFIRFINNDTLQRPYIQTKTTKDRITKKKRKQIWTRDHENKKVAVCPLSFCFNLMTCEKGEKNTFQCGHIISEHNGGTVKNDNLIPICKNCNCAMGHENWFDYDQNSGCSLVRTSQENWLQR